MKKWHLLSAGMVAMQLIYPFCLLIAASVDMNFILYSQLIYEIGVTALFFAAGIIQLVKKTPPIYWDWFLMPAVLLNGTLLMMNDGYPSMLFMAVNLLFSGGLTFRHKGWGKIIMMTGCAIAAFFMIRWGIIGYVFTGWGKEANKVVYQEKSPSGAYTAQVLSQQFLISDEHKGVQVVKNDRFSVLFGAFTHKPQFLPIGIVRENETIQITWVDEDTLCINGKQYEIPWD